MLFVCFLLLLLLFLFAAAVREKALTYMAERESAVASIPIRDGDDRDGGRGPLTKLLLGLVHALADTKSSAKHVVSQRNRAFLRPVEELYGLIPEYDTIVARRIDLSTVQDLLSGGGYSTVGDFLADLRLVFQNAITYNGRLEHISATSKEIADNARWMLQELEGRWRILSIDVWEAAVRRVQERSLEERKRQEEQKKQKESEKRYQDFIHRHAKHRQLEESIAELHGSLKRTHGALHSDAPVSTADMLAYATSEARAHEVYLARLLHQSSEEIAWHIEEVEMPRIATLAAMRDIAVAAPMATVINNASAVSGRTCWSPQPGPSCISQCADSFDRHHPTLSNRVVRETHLTEITAKEGNVDPVTPASASAGKGEHTPTDRTVPGSGKKRPRSPDHLSSTRETLRDGTISFCGFVDCGGSAGTLLAHPSLPRKILPVAIKRLVSAPIQSKPLVKVSVAFCNGA
jgi:hypothetical protein